jgi:serine O-acetyltransferase
VNDAILNSQANKRRSRGDEASAEPEYTSIVAELRQLRAASQLSRYRGAAPRLPSREAISDIVESLISALYPRHFGPPGLDARDADAFVARTLAKALPALEQQIELALALEQEDARDPANANRRSACDITRLFAAALPKIRAALDKDVRAAFANDPSAKSIDEVIFCFPGVAAIMRHRLAHELYRLGAPLLARIVAEIAHALAGVDIHAGAEIDEGFFIDHGTGVVIGETAVIGRNVRIYQAVTLGAKRFEIGGDGELLSAPSGRRGRRCHLRRRHDPRPLVDRRQCLVDGSRAVGEPHHASEDASERSRDLDLESPQPAKLPSLDLRGSAVVVSVCRRKETLKNGRFHAGELGGAPLARPRQSDRNISCDRAVVNQHDPVPKRDGFRDVVSDQNRGEAIRQPNLLEQTLHLDARQRIECAQRLIERQNARGADERARKRDALLLAARQG